MYVSPVVPIVRIILLMFWSVNRFAGTRLEDLAGEIPSLCKDQHGCRYLQKKLEEGVPEHRDMIFRETFGHFADLMTGKHSYHR
jgi:Pumilio-family RNA binding repeat